MTVAVRGIVELFKEVKREKELHRKALAFSISHDDEVVRIFGHYPVINGDNATFYRHPIHKFDFTALDGKDKWTAYKFTKNVYDIWMPDHHKLICSAIDDIPPDINFEVSIGGSFTSIAGAGESEQADSQEMATSAPTSQDTARFKKPKLPLKVHLQQEVEQLNNKLDQEREQKKQEVEQLQKKFDQEREQSNQRLTELTEQLKQLTDMLKRQASGK